MQARVNWNKRFVFTKQGLPSYVSHSGPRSRWPRHRCRKFPLILEREAILLSVSREANITGGFYAGQILEVARWAPLAPSSTCRHVMLNKFEYSACIILCFICLFFYLKDFADSDWCLRRDEEEAAEAAAAELAAAWWSRHNGCPSMSRNLSCSPDLVINRKMQIKQYFLFSWFFSFHRKVDFV